MSKLNCFLSLLIIILSLSNCKKEGCTNTLASNYDSDAKKDDGSCIEPPFYKFGQVGNEWIYENTSINSYGDTTDIDTISVSIVEQIDINKYNVLYKGIYQDNSGWSFSKEWYFNRHFFDDGDGVFNEQGTAEISQDDFLLGKKSSGIVEYNVQVDTLLCTHFYREGKEYDGELWINQHYGKIREISSAGAPGETYYIHTILISKNF